MKIVDLTLPLHTGMEVYPGDPEASIERIQTVDQDGWNMNRIQINSHDGTHVNVPLHGDDNGKTLDDYSVEAFIGRAEIYTGTILPDKGMIFRDQNIDENIAEQIKKITPPFIGLSHTLTFDEEIEKELLSVGVILYENLNNLEQLPNKFMFYGVPLKIKDGDGSPVRAFAVLE